MDNAMEQNLRHRGFTDGVISLMELLDARSQGSMFVDLMEMSDSQITRLNHYEKLIRAEMEAKNA